jgi:hypothetical protein
MPVNDRQNEKYNFRERPGGAARLPFIARRQNGRAGKRVL